MDGCLDGEPRKGAEGARIKDGMAWQQSAQNKYKNLCSRDAGSTEGYRIKLQWLQPAVHESQESFEDWPGKLEEPILCPRPKARKTIVDDVGTF